MCNLCLQVVTVVFGNLQVGLYLITPDNVRGRRYSITQITPNSIVITTQFVTQIPISRNAFCDALYYLRVNRNNAGNPCEIRSSNNRHLAGPLCRASRNVNRNVRCINYILLILARGNLVGINGGLPCNTTWYI
jgi:hypothetical protein